MKTNNKLKTVLMILIVIIISLISFVGIYGTKKQSMDNQVPEYLLGMNLSGKRVINFNVDLSNETIVKDQDGNTIESATDEEIAEKGYTKEEIPRNSEENKTEANFQACKQIIENRLKDLKFNDYLVRQDNTSGNMVIELKENTKTDEVLSSLASAGKFEIQDNDTQEVLMDNNDLEGANVVYGSTNSGNSVYLEIQFTKNSKQKFKEITEKYNTTTDEEGKEVEKQINLTIDGQSILTTSFDEPISTGKLQLSVGQAGTSSDDLDQYVGQATNMATLLNNGKMPVAYTIEGNKYVQSPITKENANIAIGITIAIIAIAMVYIIIKYKKEGMLATISYIGLDALFLLILRLTNVEITIEGLFAIGLVFVFNYIVLLYILNNMKKETSEKLAIKNAIIRFCFLIIPVYMIAIVFSFITYAPINSLGTVMFWGITLNVLYHIVYTRTLLMHVKQK